MRHLYPHSSPVFAEDSISYAYASHTFHVTEIEDKTVALFVVQYKSMSKQQD